MRPLLVAVLVGMLFAAGTGLLRGDGDGEATRIDRLVKQLGDDEFARRESATRTLEEIGEPALEALRKAAASDPDLEVRRRAERVIGTLARRVTERELEKLQGSWSLVSYECAGKQIKGEDKGHVFSFTKDRWAITIGGHVDQAGTVTRIEPHKDHGAIDLLITEGGNAGATAISIYRVEGDSLKYLNSGEPRAQEFSTSPGDGRYYLSFRRVKP
jgi:uncharacterized protein (TIGR03067 family)